MKLYAKLIFITLTLLGNSCKKEELKVPEITHKVEKKLFESVITETGEIGSEKEFDVTAPFSTKIDELLPEGSIVNPKTILGRLSTDKENQEKEKIDLNSKELSFDLKISEIGNKKDLYKKQKEIEQLELELKIAELKLKRFSQGRDGVGIVTAEETLNTINREKSIIALEIVEKEKLVKLGYLSKEELLQVKNKLAEIKEQEKYTTTNLKVLEAGPTKEEIEKEATNVTLAKENLNKAKKELEIINKTLELAVSEIKNKMKRNVVKVSYYEDLIKNGILFSNSSGVLVYGKMSVGEEEVKVKAGDSIREGTAILKIYDLQTPVLRLKINEVDIPKIKLNQNVRFFLDSFPEKQFTGKVVFISTIAEKSFEWSQNEVNVFDVTVKINETDKALKPGITANAELISDTLADTIAIPSQAILKDKEKFYCLLKTPEGLKKQEVTLGLSNDMETEVKKGLKENDLVIINTQEIKI